VGGKFKEFFKNFLQRIFELYRIYNGFFGILLFLAHFDLEFKGVIENLEAGRMEGLFKDINMRYGGHINSATTMFRGHREPSQLCSTYISAKVRLYSKTLLGVTKK
jgi:hypothetical protein